MNNDNISDKLQTTALSVVVEDENEPSLPVLFHLDNKQVHSSVCTVYASTASTNTTLTCVQTCQTPDLTHTVIYFRESGNSQLSHTMHNLLF